MLSFVQIGIINLNLTITADYRKGMVSIMEKKFKELYLAGEIEFEAIDDYSYEWGMSDEECTLAQYLGLNAEEEDAWVSDSEDALRELLDKQKR